MKSQALAFFTLLLMSLPAAADGPSLFDYLHGLDGKSYPGRMTFPSDPNHDMNKPMQITVQVVSDNEIRIPLHVGEDRSRTWILTRSSEGVLLKHDHRHPDGTPDELTNYGGLASKVELGTLLVFPADQETATMLPEAATNAWSLRLSPDRSQLYYYLERHLDPRFEATFDLSAK
jgi:hypothetical protein